MKRFVCTVALLFSAFGVRAQVIVTAGDGFAVADAGRVRLFDAAGTGVIWTAQGVERPSKIVVTTNKLAVIDSFADRIAIVENGVTRFIDTGASPIDALFAGADLVVLSRDARLLERHGGNGQRAVVELAADAAFLREANGFAYVYSRLEGVVQEISLTPFAMTRRATLAPYAADFETDGTNGYLLFPREATLRAFPLSTLKVTSESAAGGAPADLELLRRASTLSATRIAIADPAARRVWTMEGLQSVGRAFSRGFLRGLLGLRLFAPSQSEFPTGVDRVIAAGSSLAAFDSTTGTLYRLKGAKIETIAKGIAATGFTASKDGIAVLENGTIRLIR